MVPRHEPRLRRKVQLATLRPGHLALPPFAPRGKGTDPHPPTSPALSRKLQPSTMQAISSSLSRIRPSRSRKACSGAAGGYRQGFLQGCLRHPPPPQLPGPARQYCRLPVLQYVGCRAPGICGIHEGIPSCHAGFPRLHSLALTALLTTTCITCHQPRCKAASLVSQALVGPPPR